MRQLPKAAFVALLLSSTIAVSAYSASGPSTGCIPGVQRAQGEGGPKSGAQLAQGEGGPKTGVQMAEASAACQ